MSPTTQTWGAGVPRPRRRSWHRSAVSPDPSGRKRAHLVSPVHPGREEPPYFWAPRRLRHTRNHPARHRDRPGGSVSARMRSIRAWSRRVTCACCRSCSFQDATTNCSTMCDGSSLARRLRHELAPVRRRLSFAASSATASPPHVPLPSPVVDRHQAGWDRRHRAHPPGAALASRRLAAGRRAGWPGIDSGRLRLGQNRLVGQTSNAHADVRSHANWFRAAHGGGRRELAPPSARRRACAAHLRPER